MFKELFLLQQMSNDNDKNVDVNDYELVAVSKLSDEEKRMYKSLGKALFGNTQFKGSEIVNTDEDPPEEVCAFVVRQLDDGIHPSFLEEGEIAVLEKNYGTEWYKKWKYVDKDLTEVFTVDRN